MRFVYLVTLLSILVLVASCTSQPDADTIYQQLRPGEARFVVRMNGEPFYPDDSRFKGEVTITPASIRLNLFDQRESNTIIVLTGTDLFTRRPIVRPILLDNQGLGSVMIGKVRDKAQHTGDGFLMTEGILAIDHLSDERIVIQFTGKTGNFNTMHDRTTWKRLNGLLVYRKPPVKMPSANKQTLFY